MGKMVIWSDVHLHEWTYGAKYINGVNSRLLSQINAINEITQYMIDHDIRFSVFCGDMFLKHGTLTAPVLDAAYSVFKTWKDYGFHSKFLVGNHDMSSRSTHCMNWLNEMGQVILEPTLIGDNIVACGFTKDKKILDNVFEQAEGKLVFLHQGVSGVPMGSGMVLNEILTADYVNKYNVKHCFTGHYHEFSSVSEKLTVVGSLMPHTWADINPRGFLVYDTEKNEYERIIIKSAPSFCKIDYCGVPIINYTTQAIEKVKGNFIKIRNFPGDMDKERELLLSFGALHVDFELPQAEEKSIAQEMSKVYNIKDAIDLWESCVDKHTKEVGRQLREGKYDIPNFQS